MTCKAAPGAPLAALLITLLACVPATAGAEAAPAALEGLSVDASLLVVGQRALRGTVHGKDETRTNLRADIELGLPAGNIGAAEGELFAHLRLGEGNGLRWLPPTYTGTANSTTFDLDNGNDDAAMLAQIWYGLKVPLGGAEQDARRSLEVNIGKIDPFAFFDQNDVADDESAAFMNNVFVHNPLLDSGGDMDVDAHGFAPGLRIAYRNESPERGYWQASLAAFSPGEDSTFDVGTARPFVIGQIEAGGQFLSGLAGAYRLYAWSRERATPYANELDSSINHHSGWGVSANQQVGEQVTLFGRYGHSTEGRMRFDRALTLGAEIGGGGWGREDDRFGLAAGWLDTSSAFRATAPTLDADGDGTADFGYLPARAEKQFEVYYAWRVNAHLELSSDLQWIIDPGGDAAAGTIAILGLRAKAVY